MTEWKDYEEYSVDIDSGDFVYMPTHEWDRLAAKARLADAVLKALAWVETENLGNNEIEHAVRKCRQELGDA